MRTWLGSVAPEWQAEPPETETPFRSRAMTRASPSRLSNQMLVVLAARGTGLLLKKQLQVLRLAALAQDDTVMQVLRLAALAQDDTVMQVLRLAALAQDDNH